MSNLVISNSLSLPLELAARTQCILAQKGAGKTYLGMKETEEMLEAKLQVVCLDPTGVWWGLRSSADGKSEGYPIIVMGGEHCDIPLEPHAGEIVADFIVDSGQAVILDLSGFETNAQQDRFATAFAERIYRRKASDRAPLHLMIDEADSFAPQRPMPGQQRMLGAFEAIVRRGRSRGIGLTMISQRPAVLNKNVMSQADLLVCLRVVGQHDHKALREWTDLHANKTESEEFLKTLPALENGEAWFWSPGWLGIFKRARIAKRKTFDSSNTPAPGEVRLVPKKLAAVDLDKLSGEIKQASERAKANDPAELKKTIADSRLLIVELKRQLEKGHTEFKTVEVPVLKDGQIERLEKAGDRFLNEALKLGVQLSESLNKFIAASTEVRDKLGWAIAVQRGETIVELGDGSMPWCDACHSWHPVPRDEAHKKALRCKAPDSKPIASPISHPQPTQMAAVRSVRAARSASTLTANLHGATAAGGNLPSGGMRRMMIALAQRPGLTKRQLGIRAGMSSSSGTFGTYLAKMRTNGWLDGEREALGLTAAGVAAIGSYEPLPEGFELYNYWLGQLGQSGAARILEVLVKAHPRSLSKVELGEQAEMSSGSGTFGTYLSKLRSLELIAGTRELKASEEFFT